MTAALAPRRRRTPSRRAPLSPDVVAMLPELAELVAGPDGSRRWELSAPCAQACGDSWFPAPGNVADLGSTAETNLAKRVCVACPFRARCLAGAVRRSEQYGIWGGLASRQILQVRHALGLTPADVARRAGGAS